LRTVGIIAEYNPFHNGHAYHIEASKEITGSQLVVAVMSGSFVQRGEPAIIDKYARTLMALRNGIDLVIELPVSYALSSAENFAKGAVSLLTRCGIVDCLCFGSEHGRVEELKRTACLLSDEDKLFKKRINKELGAGRSYPAARERAVSAAGASAELLRSPNNILGIEYLKALIKTQSPLEPYTLRRAGAGYNSVSIDEHMPSASAIRQAALGGQLEKARPGMPESCYDIMLREAERFLSFNDFSLLVHSKLMREDLNWLSGILDVTEGLENKIIKESESHFLLEDLAAAVKSKRYTAARLRRIFMHILLNISKQELEEFEKAGGPGYVRVLGFRKESAFLLKALSDKSSLPVVINLKEDIETLEGSAKRQLEKELLASDLYYIARASKGGGAMGKGAEYRQPIVIV